MRRLVLTIALASVLSGAVRAGEIPSTGVVATPTPTPVAAAYEEIHITGVANPEEIHSTAEAAPEPSMALTIILTIISFVF